MYVYTWYNTTIPIGVEDELLLLWETTKNYEYQVLLHTYEVLRGVRGDFAFIYSIGQFNPQAISVQE